MQNKSIDFGHTIESFLRGIYILAWQILKTAWDFNFKSELFDRAIGVHPQSSKLHTPAEAYVRPMTYLSLTSLLLIFAGVQQDKTFKQPPSTQFNYVVKAVTSGDTLKIVSIVMSEIIIIAIYSYAIVLVVKLLRGSINIKRSITFEQAIRINSYFLGTNFLLLSFLIGLNEPGLYLANTGRTLLYLPFGLLSLGCILSITWTIGRYIAQIQRSLSAHWLQALLVPIISLLITVPATVIALSMLGAALTTWFTAGN